MVVGVTLWPRLEAYVPATEQRNCEILYSVLPIFTIANVLHFSPQAQNRFKVPVGTKFYRVKAVPWKNTQVTSQATSQVTSQQKERQKET